MKRRPPLPTSSGPAGRRAWAGLSLALLAGLVCLSSQTAPRSDPAATLGKVDSWIYQLQGYPDRLQAIARSGFRLAVVDPSSDGTPAGRWTAREVQAARRGKLLFAYLSIGEAEAYRGYWRANWKPGSPPWLVQADPDWPGHFVVKYWDPAWQATVLAALDDILAQGFDGAYLDLVDGYDSFPGVRTARRDMVRWVCTLRAHARRARPGFLIIAQNASELIREPGYRDCIDATAQEETFFRATDQPTGAEDRAFQLATYAEYRRRGLPVFSVDYADVPAHVASAYRSARAAGLVEYVTNVELDRLRINAPHDPR